MIERIKRLIAESGLSERAFAIQCGLAQNTLNRQMSGERELSLTVVLAILSTYPEISAEWLLRGEGEPTKKVKPVSDRETLLIDTIAMQQETINNLKTKIKSLEAELIIIDNNKAM